MKNKLMVFALIVSIILVSLPAFGQGLPDEGLQYGSRSVEVVKLQELLNNIGYNLTLNGTYGKQTRASILDFQKKYKGLENNGVYDANTKKAIKGFINGESQGDKGEEKDKAGKIAYLTFDDGPSTTLTPSILDILNQYNIRGTFFVLGDMAEKNPDIIKRINSQGHSIGNHSYSHKYDFLYKNMDNFLEEINKTNNVLKNILGEEFDSRLLRFPGGSFEDYKDKYKEAARDLGYRIYDWNAVNGDAESKEVSTDYLVERLKQTTRGKKQVIILMHDSYGKESTVEALPQIIEYLISEGYSFHQLDQ